MPGGGCVKSSHASVCCVGTPRGMVPAHKGAGVVVVEVKAVTAVTAGRGTGESLCCSASPTR